eukprot:9416048-Alexandrium_andersonii.AAC.1
MHAKRPSWPWHLGVPRLSGKDSRRCCRGNAWHPRRAKRTRPNEVLAKVRVMTNPEPSTR